VKGRTAALVTLAIATALSFTVALPEVAGGAPPDPSLHAYWIFFRAPQGKTHVPAQSDLTARGIRRLAQVGHLIGSDPADFPFDPTLLDPLRERGLLPRVRNVSRWLEAASVLLTADQAREVESDPRVDGVRPVAHFARTIPPAPPPSVIPPVPSAAKPLGRAADRDPRTLRPGDYGQCWDQLEMLGIPEMHRRGWSGAGVIVAIFDTGFYKDHMSLYPLDEIAEHDFVLGDSTVQYDPHDPRDVARSNDHGTYTWSTLGGFDPGRQIGPAYRASFLLAKTEDVSREVHAEEDNYIAALEWADGLGADIVSSSLGYRYFDDGTGYTLAQLDGETAPITIATEIAAQRGVLVVTAIGNDGQNGVSSLGVPADGKRVLSIGAVDVRGRLADFSSRGPTGDGRIKPDVDAMGVAVHCGFSSSPISYGAVSGTSLSTPLAAGLAALLLEARPTWGPDSLIHAIRASGSRHMTPDNDYGWGIADGLRALGASEARLVARASVWTEETGSLREGIPGWGETGALDLWIRNDGGSASEAGTIRILSHDSRMTLLDSVAVAVPALTTGDSALARVARVRFGAGTDLRLIPAFVEIDAGADTIDRRLVLPVIPPYSIQPSAQAGALGTVRLSWTAVAPQGVVTKVRIHRSSAADTARVLVHEENPQATGVWIDHLDLPGTYSYWFTLALFGGRESRAQGPLTAVIPEQVETRFGSPFPNPASKGTVAIPLSWTRGDRPRVEIYDIAGRWVRTLSGVQGQAYPRFDWDLKGDDGRSVATGVYIARAPGAGSVRVLVIR